MAPKTSKTSAKILKIVNQWSNHVRKDWKKDAKEDEDPLSQLCVMPDTSREVILEAVPEEEKQYYDFSTRITGFENVPREGMVTLLFDGLAWDFLSYESEFQAYRDDLEARLEKQGFCVENASACAISIYEA